MTEPFEELSSTGRGFLLCLYLLEGKRTIRQVADHLGYRGYSGAANLLYRMRVGGLVQDDDGRWYVVRQGDDQR